MGVFFSIRTRKPRGLAALQVRVQMTRPKVNIIQSTPLKVDIETYQLDRNSLKWGRFIKSQEGMDLLQKQRAIENGISFILQKGRGISPEQVRKVVEDVCYAELRRKENEEQERVRAAEAEENRMTFQKYRRLYLQQILSDGRATCTGKNFAPSTVVSVGVTFKRLDGFEQQQQHIYDFDEIDMNFYRDFIAFLKQIPYNLNTIGKIIRIIKTVMRCAKEDGYHSNLNYMGQSFKAPRADSDAIYLTRNELERIDALDLSKCSRGRQIARDLFMIGVWTAQRVSDYNRLSRKSIQTETIRYRDENGNLTEREVMTIHMVQQKTGKKVVIPCNKELRSLLGKYPEHLPHLSEQKLNQYLKELGMMAGLTEEVVVRSTKGGVLRTERLPKYSLIHSHTARRTGATLMYLSGMNVYDICKITGHSNIKTLERYIKADELETVKRITETYDYFK